MNWNHIGIFFYRYERPLGLIESGEHEAATGAINQCCRDLALHITYKKTLNISHRKNSTSMHSTA